MTLENQTDPDALFDEIVFIPLQFLLQTLAFSVDLLGRVLRPCSADICARLVGESGLQVLCNIKITFDIFALFCFVES